MPDLTPNLDYNASAPMDQKSPVSVKVDPDKPPGVRVLDFVPSPRKLREMENAGPKSEPELGPHREGVVVDPSADFIPYEETVKRQEAQKKRIVEVAKRIYGEKRALILEFDRARKVVKNMTKGERENPKTREQKRALKIVARGHPMPKKRAIELAKRRIHAEIRQRM